jgi:response regulator RpfG family c-di-GMP phosphodiesterase
MKSVLIVDDDPLLVESYALACGTKYTVDTALSGQEALEKIAAQGPYAVVLSDMSMPKMNGAVFLAKVREQWPNTVRIMLTGDRGWETPVAAVNEGQVFRFLIKPCALPLVLQAVDDGMRQHELILAEKELIEKTLHGSIDILTEMLSVADAAELLRSQKLRERASRVARALQIENPWEIEIAAMLRRIGAMTVPADILAKGRQGAVLTTAEKQLLLRIPEIGSKLLVRIPRLGGVANIVLYQAKQFDGAGFPNDPVAGEKIPLGARLLKILSDFLTLEAKGIPPATVLKELSGRNGWYDPALLPSVGHLLLAPVASAESKLGRPVTVKDLIVGQKLAANVLTKEGVVLLSAGYVVTEAVRERLQNFHAFTGIQEPLYVENPTAPG